ALAQLVGQGPVRHGPAGDGLLLDLLERRLPLVPAAPLDHVAGLGDHRPALDEGDRPGRLAAVDPLPLAAHPGPVDPLVMLLAVDVAVDLAAPVVPDVRVAVLLPDVLLEVPDLPLLILDVDLHEGVGEVG